MRSICPCLVVLACLSAELTAAPTSGNRFTVLDKFCDIYYPNHLYPRLTTPQWIGEEGVDAVLVFAIDDMRETAKYETYLRPILERLKQVDGRAPVSIMTCNIKPDEPQLQTWLKEGVSIETHTITHPCPILDKGDFAAAKSTYDRCVDLLNSVPNSRPVAFRTPCMDGINSASPRLFAEIMMRTTEQGNFLTMSSSIGMVLTEEDPENPKELVLDGEGKPRFNKYLLPGYINYIKNYPYPYLIGNMFWETAFPVPDDYEASRVFGDKSPKTIADMEASIDAVVAKKGIWVMTFHPYQWIDNMQIIELIDHSVTKHGKKVKFLNLREMNERLEKNLLAGQPIRGKNGAENGARLLDLNGDGYLDVVVANDKVQQTRIWQPGTRSWRTTEFPARIVTGGRSAGVRFGMADEKRPCAFVSNEKQNGFWIFDNDQWQAVPERLAGLELRGRKVLSASAGLDRGVRLRDVNGDGTCELIVSNPDENAIFTWNPAAKSWKKLEFSLPEGVSIVTADGRDNGVRFVDLNKDGADDVILSNEKSYGLWLGVPKLFLGFKEGWSRQVMRGKRGEKPEIPMIVRGGDYPNNGAWFSDEMMWVQNEDTGKLPDLVDRVAVRDLLNGFQPAPKSPKEALQSFVVSPEFVVEVVAHEPAVLDPVSFEWGADGTLWVAEMRDYPRGINGKSGGVVTRLRDEDGDGFYENATVFADNLNFPNGVMPWKDGLLVSAAPNILFLEDTDNDGKADRTTVLFRGFVEGNQQHRMNGFELGLDNWIYGANGDSGGVVETVKTGKKISISGRDFRFKPDGSAFDTTSGNTQYGRRRDDWGDWFGGANYTWGWHYVYPEESIRRNPELAVKSTKRPLNTLPDGSRVYPISRVQQRFNDIGMAGHVTSACSFTPYRADLFGGDFDRSIFICEPTHNLVHREVLEPDGVSFKSHRAPGEEQREFLASTDPWFRPTTMKTGPDGAIYIADMYRLVIEHPEWIPKDVQERVNLRAGEDQGRIYRVRPKDAVLRKIPNFGQLQAADLARAMDSPNGWQRDTIHRLLLEQRPKEAISVLAAMVRENPGAKVRLQALCALSGLDAISDELLETASSDANPYVRLHAIRLAEPKLRGTGSIARKILSMTDDPDIHVRYQLAYSLGESQNTEATRALAMLAKRDGNSVEVTTAILSSAASNADALLYEVLRSGADGEHIESLVSQLARQSKDTDRVTDELERQVQAGAVPGWKLTAFSQLLANQKKADAAKIEQIASRARRIVRSADALERDRVAVLPLIGKEANSRSDDVNLLAGLLAPENPPALQTAAISRLGQMDDPGVPDALLKNWKRATPAVRNAILAIFLKRPSWTQVLLGRISVGELAAADLGANGRQALLTHSSRKVREKAEEIFKPQSSERQKVVSTYLQNVSPLSGTAAHGRELFETHCAVCHRMGNLGTGAGPNLAMLYDQGLETILVAVLDPNRAVEEKYWNYTVDLKNGDQFSGILLNESANSVTLMGISGVEQTFLRRDIATMNSSSRSIMPEGFEQFLQPQDLADLVAFIRVSPAN